MMWNDVINDHRELRFLCSAWIHKFCYLSIHVAIQVTPTSIPNRIPTYEPPEVPRIVPVAVIVESGFVVEPSAGEGIRIGDSRSPRTVGCFKASFPNARPGVMAAKRSDPA